jgi:hypothetical protein
MCCEGGFRCRNMCKPNVEFASAGRLYVESESSVAWPIAEWRTSLCWLASVPGTTDAVTTGVGDRKGE